MKKLEGKGMSTKVDLAVELMIEEAKGRKLPNDYVSRLYQVEMEVTGKINQAMSAQRQTEREQKKKQEEDEPSL